MTLGEKIKKARMDMGLSQRQLCGEMITRNMLSQIESGKAGPSMTTLQYLAGQLGKPISYFLEEDALCPVDQALEAAREAFSKENFLQALELLSQGSEKSEEAAFLEYLCLAALARDALQQQKLPYARQLLEKAAQVQTIYKTQVLETERQLLYLLCGGDGALFMDERPLLLRAEKVLEENNTAAAARYLDACDRQDARWALLRGKTFFLEKNYPAALETLKGAEKAFPRQALPLLEACCKELEDYKQAYYYACLQR